MFQRFIYGLVGLAVLAPAMHAQELPEKYLTDSLPTRWEYLPENTIESPSPSDTWWKQFNDATLDSLIALGLDNNYNLSMAMRRTEMARAAMGQARAAWYPAVNLSGSWNKGRQSGMSGPVAGPAMDVNYFNAGLTAQWEVDIFGKIASGVKAKKAGYRASKAEYAGAMVSVTAQIAATYMQLRMYQELLDISLEHTENQMKIVNIAKARFETTLASKLDVAQALSTYYSTIAAIPMLENSIVTSINALAVLTGQPLDAMQRLLTPHADLPNPVQMIQAGVPADILRRRPDIAQAEMELAQYAAQAGIAKKDFLPTLTLQGSVGTQAHRAGDLFKNPSFTYSIAPTLSWTLFDGMARSYALTAAKEQLKMGVDNYNLTVETAVQEVDNALSTYYHSLRQMEANSQLIVQNQEALRLAIDRYKNSLSPMSDVISAQLNALSSASNLVSAHGSALAALINLYEALGGGYDASTIQ